MAPSQFASLTDVGLRRRSNQDAFGELPLAGGGVLLVCCDGMGGHQGGEVASRLAIETILRAVDPAAPAAGLPQAIDIAHDTLRKRAAERPELHGMGTTVVALCFDGERRAWIAHVGDSRCYRLRAGTLEALTHDHSVVAELLRAGQITPDEAATRANNQLTRALGASAAAMPECAEHEVRAGDVFALCSDGLWNMVGEAAIADVLRREPPAAAARRLVELANAAGGVDNVTVQVLAVGAPPHAATGRPATPAEAANDGSVRAIGSTPTRGARWWIAGAVLLASVALGWALSRG